MSAKRFRRVDRHTAGQQGLDGVPDRARDALDELLADASAPARPGELAGEEAAVAAFRTARLAGAGQPRRSSMHSLTKLVTVKVAAAAIGAMAVGGVAFAAATGNLPSHGGSTDPATTGVTTSSAAQGKQPAPGESNDKPKPDNGKRATQAPSLKGLCEAYSPGPASEQGKRLDSPAFGALVSAAGGKDKVPAYCQKVLGEPRKPAEPPQPNEHQQPNGPKPNEHKQNEPRQPERKPDRPAPAQGRADDHPTGKPDTGPPPSARPKN